MDSVDLRAKTQDELRKTLNDLKKEQLNLRFQKANGVLENTSELGRVRRNVARVMTVLNEKSGVVPAATS